MVFTVERAENPFGQKQGYKLQNRLILTTLLKRLSNGIIEPI